MRNIYHTGDEIEYRGYILKMADDHIEVYDKDGNYLKQSTFRTHGSLSDMKSYIDNLIKRYGK